MNYNSEVKSKFNNLNSLQDFANLLQYILIEKVQFDITIGTFEITPNLLTFFSFSLKKGEAYSQFEIKKKSGGTRKISTPKFALKIVQKCLLELFMIIYKPHKSAHGFVARKSVATNASVHVGKRYILNIDIQDFFPSTKYHKINFLLSIRPFHLNGPKSRIATIIANLCCENGALPQGAPTWGSYRIRVKSSHRNSDSIIKKRTLSCDYANLTS